MANPRGSKANSLAGIRADRKNAEQRQKAKEKRDSASLIKKYKNKKKPKQNSQEADRQAKYFAHLETNLIKQNSYYQHNCAINIDQGATVKGKAVVPLLWGTGKMCLEKYTYANKK